MRRAVLRWAAGVEQERLEILRDGQNAVSDTIETRNNILGAFANITDRQHLYLEEMEDIERRLGRKSLLNHFTRFYLRGTERALRNWKLALKRGRDRETLIRRVLYKQYKLAFTLWTSAVSQEHKAANTRRKRVAIQEVEFQSNEFQQQITNNEEVHSQEVARERQKLDRSTAKKLGQIDTLKKRRVDTISGMIRRNHTTEWSSRKRKVFEEWRKVARRQRVFYRNLSKVCNKSLYAISFQKIKDAEKRNRKLLVLQKVLSRWLRAVKKDTLSATMSQWKFYCHTEAVVGERSKMAQLRETIANHQATWENVQE